MTLLLERTADPEDRSVELEERLVVLPEVLRLVRAFWSVPLAERAVVEPVLRLVVAEEVLPVERLVVLLPVERLVLPLCELRLVRSFCA